MSIKFYNTLTRTKDEFKPINDKEIRMYSCGPTVYYFAHIGNLRAYLLHIYRHGHGEDRDISRTAENQLKNMVDEYSQALKN